VATGAIARRQAEHPDRDETGGAEQQQMGGHRMAGKGARGHKKIPRLAGGEC
jgi:hypothetical protein